MAFDKVPVSNRRTDVNRMSIFNRKTSSQSENFSNLGEDTEKLAKV